MTISGLPDGSCLGGGAKVFEAESLDSGGGGWKRLGWRESPYVNSDGDESESVGPLSDGAGMLGEAPDGMLGIVDDANAVPGIQGGAPGTPSRQVIVAEPRPTSATVAPAVSVGGCSTAMFTIALPGPMLVGLISMLARPLASVGTSTRLLPGPPTEAPVLETS